jgi:hypothetical protein
VDATVVHVVSPAVEYATLEVVAELKPHIVTDSVVMVGYPGTTEQRFPVGAACLYPHLLHNLARLELYIKLLNKNNGSKRAHSVMTSGGL